MNVCGVSQLLDVKVREEGLTVPSVRSLLETRRLTFCDGEELPNCGQEISTDSAVFPWVLLSLIPGAEIPFLFLTMHDRILQVGFSFCFRDKFDFPACLR